MKSNGGVFGLRRRLNQALIWHYLVCRHQRSTFWEVFVELKNMITLDMGGTSTDISLIRDGQAETTTATRINDLPLAYPLLTFTQSVLVVAQSQASLPTEQYLSGQRVREPFRVQQLMEKVDIFQP